MTVRVCRCGETITPAGSAWIGGDGWESCLGTEDFHEPAHYCRFCGGLLGEDKELGWVHWRADGTKTAACIRSGKDPVFTMNETSETAPAEVPAEQARVQLADLLTAAKEHGRVTVITRHGKPVAELGGLDRAVELQRLREQEKRIRALAEDMRTWCSPHGVAADYADRIVEALDGVEVAQ